MAEHKREIEIDLFSTGARNIGSNSARYAQGRGATVHGDEKGEKQRIIQDGSVLKAAIDWSEQGWILCGGD
jgi:hypothetical protein